VILETDAAHCTVVFAHGVVVARHAHAEVAFVFAQLVGSFVVAEPREFEPEAGLSVAQIDEFETAVGSLAACLPQSQRPVVEGEAPLQIGDVDVEMVEFAFDFHVPDSFCSAQN